MAGLNLRNAVRDDTGLIVGESLHVTLHDSGGNATSHQIPSFTVDIKREILEAVYNAGGVVTRGQIAKATGRKKTPWLHDHIEELVQMGFLVRHHGVWRNGCLMYWYEAAQ